MAPHPTPLLCTLDLQLQIGNVSLLIIQSLLNGGLLAMGAICIFFLVSPNRQPQEGDVDRHSRGRLKHSKFWILYISILLFLNMASVVLLGLEVFLRETVVDMIRISILTSTIYLTDGVLVWRCYKVQSALCPHPGGLLNIATWAFPLCIYLVTLVTGLTLAITVITTQKIPNAVVDVALMSNGFLNLYATCFITIRLSWFRRMYRVYRTADSDTRYSRWLIQIFLEAAVINVPIVLIAAIFNCLGSHYLSSYLTTAGVSCQSFSTLLILHQVVLGKAIGQAEETKKPE